MEMRSSLLGNELSEPRRRALPLLDVALDAQADITYHEATVRSVLNGPAATGIGAWSLNPYVGCAFGCAYCYARYAHRYVMERATAAGAPAPADGEELPPWLAFERRVLVKRDAPALVRQALGRHAARHARLLAGLEAVVVGTATDPYQPAERRFQVTRGVLEALAEHDGLRVVIITKSPLVVRDLDVLARLATRSRLSVHVSLITLDRALARRIEPRAPTPEARLRAVQRLAEAGIDVGVNVMPVLPGITDDPFGLEALVRQVAAAGARHLAAGALRLQPAARDRYLPWVADAFPDLAARYRATYARGPNAGERYRDGLRERMAVLCERYGIGTRTYDESRMRANARRAAEARGTRAAVHEPTIPEATLLAFGI
jgi:DNA repair photolyase